jgi:hypothetical protein
LALVTGITATAQETNLFRRTDYAAFRIINERNIFNQYRVARHHEKGGAVPTTPEGSGNAFSLVGTMSYEKGDFAFFDGKNAEYRKIIRPEGAIAGYKVIEITPQSVKLESSGQQIEMKVGMQMRRDDENMWQLVTAHELPATPAGSSVASPTGTTSSSSSGDVNDMPEEPMQQREQELK